MDHPLTSDDARPSCGRSSRRWGRGRSGPPRSSIGSTRRERSAFDAFTSLPKPLREKLAGRFAFRRARARRQALVRRRDDEASSSASATAQHIEIGPHPGRDAADGLPLDPGRLQVRLRLLRQRPPRLQARPLARPRSSARSSILESALGRDLTNFVFMGMGEPLDNWTNVEKAIRIMNAPEGLGIAARRITVSTAGFIRRLQAARGPRPPDQPVDLPPRRRPTGSATGSCPSTAASRSRTLVEAAEDYIRSGGRMITLEYIVIRGLNDSLDDADGLAGIARRLRAKVNLIAYSPVERAGLRDADRGRHRPLQALARGAEGQHRRAPVQGHRHRRRLRPAGRPLPGKAAPPKPHAPPRPGESHENEPPPRMARPARRSRARDRRRRGRHPRPAVRHRPAASRRPGAGPPTPSASSPRPT